MMPKWVPEQRGQRICAIVTMLRKPRSKPMDTYTQAPPRVFVDLLEKLSATSSMDAKIRVRWPRDHGPLSSAS